MQKKPIKYFNNEPWKITEAGFNPKRSKVSESVFSLSNEYMGVRGYFEEGYSGDTLKGSYLNGIFEERSVTHDTPFIGFVDRMQFMVNSVDWLYTEILIEGEKLDLNKSIITSFKRELDLRNGVLAREFIWKLKGRKEIKIKFERFLSMSDKHIGVQRISLTPQNFSNTIKLSFGLDFSPAHNETSVNYWTCPKKGFKSGRASIIGKTKKTLLHIFSSFTLRSNKRLILKSKTNDKYAGFDTQVKLAKGEECIIDKLVFNYSNRNRNALTNNVWKKANSVLEKYKNKDYKYFKARQSAYWQDVWGKIDIEIEGSAEDQQGIRFCLFNLHQVYKGDDPTLNVGAKGLTGERYWGWTWWDTETYCLPFYLFSNPKAAKSLIEYRYNYLLEAKKRAKEMDCKGACYPMGTIDGTESCGTWQHGNLEVHVTGAVAYGIWHYMKVYNDKEYLYSKGIEVLINISRYYASRGAWNQKKQFGIYGVMGPDEFHMMVNNNCYTNCLAKKTFEFTLFTIKAMQKRCPEKLKKIFRKEKIKSSELQNWFKIAKNMVILFDKKTNVFEQHDGYFNLPHIDINSIPEKDFPLYNNWAYDRIFRYDMIKQPDVLLMLFLFSSEFNKNVKKANYEYYEPRCAHESSLSPSIHSIVASEIGKAKEAERFFSYATRIDLDDYNRDTHQGLHVTSMASSWMNIVYGFGGLRSDGNCLSVNPSRVKKWKSYSFKIAYKGNVLQVAVKDGYTELKMTEKGCVKLNIYGRITKVDNNGIKVKISRNF